MPPTKSPSSSDARVGVRFSISRSLLDLRRNSVGGSRKNRPGPSCSTSSSSSQSNQWRDHNAREQQARFDARRVEAAADEYPT
eukprot:CAMPEP_0206803612 /NCGR_PEP_ID=MMETSP0975-20121206/3305_1 /ASSEMBLY_ACC=CAM_ASM_000399 /TAXON_ID=483370 /ORGANISM="non described non described, Strain CCMP2097" /LENGTH=82 /DNA_ID=CAMNT_0054345655 /DNA_START=931 /DNA_END=1176 /DNA_ORIENTATION=-